MKASSLSPFAGKGCGEGACPTSPQGRATPNARITFAASPNAGLPAGATLVTMRRHVDSVGRILPDLVAQGAYGHPEHARGAGPVSVAARKRLQHQLPLDLADGGPDQQRHDLVRGQ